MLGRENIASVSQNNRTRKIIFLSRFWISFLGLPWNFFHGVCTSKYFFAANYTNLNLSFGHEPPRWMIPFQKIQTRKIKEFGKAPGILLPRVYGSTLKNLTLTFCPKCYSWLPQMYSDFQKVVGQKPIVIFFRVAPYVEVTFRMGFLKRAFHRCLLMTKGLCLLVLF